MNSKFELLPLRINLRKFKEAKDFKERERRYFKYTFKAQFHLTSGSFPSREVGAPESAK